MICKKFLYKFAYQNHHKSWVFKQKLLYSPTFWQSINKLYDMAEESNTNKYPSE